MVHEDGRWVVGHEPGDTLCCGPGALWKSCRCCLMCGVLEAVLPSELSWMHQDICLIVLLAESGERACNVPLEVSER